MARSNASAKKAGSTFERSLADWFKDNGHQFADRRVKTGAKDKGDLANVMFQGSQVAIECKDYGGQLKLAQWLSELHTEMENLETEYGAIIAKRRGKGSAEDQWVVMDVATFNRFLTK